MTLPGQGEPEAFVNVSIADSIRSILELEAAVRLSPSLSSDQLPDL